MEGSCSTTAFPCVTQFSKMLKLCASLQATTALEGTKLGVMTATGTIRTTVEAEAATMMQETAATASAVEATAVTAKEAAMEAVGVGVTGGHLHVCCLQILGFNFGSRLQCHACPYITA